MARTSTCLAVALGAPRHVQLLTLESGDEKVAIVHQHVADAGVGEIGGELGLPHALGQPETGGADAETRLERIAHPVDLLDAIVARQRDQHRLVVAGEQQLDFAGRDQLADQIEIAAVARLQPLEQRTRDVHDDRKELALHQRIEQRTVHVASVLLENVSEIADGLMLVDAEDESERAGQRPGAARRDFARRLRRSAHARTEGTGCRGFTFVSQMSRPVPSVGIVALRAADALEQSGLEPRGVTRQLDRESRVAQDLDRLDSSEVIEEPRARCEHAQRASLELEQLGRPLDARDVGGRLDRGRRERACRGLRQAHHFTVAVAHSPRIVGEKIATFARRISRAALPPATRAHLATSRATPDCWISRASFDIRNPIATARRHGVQLHELGETRTPSSRGGFLARKDAKFSTLTSPRPPRIRKARASAISPKR